MKGGGGFFFFGGFGGGTLLFVGGVDGELGSADDDFVAMVEA